MGLAPGLRPGRGFDAGVSGRDALAQLDAMIAGEQRALLLLGGDLLGNVLDVERASAALAAARVIAVTGHGGPTLAHADVVLPAAVANERVGTTTNIEGRVTSLAAMIVAPGSAWNDVAIAGELAEEFGQNLGLASVEETARAIEETTGYPALTVLNDGSSDGVLFGRGDVAPTRQPLDPMAFPGIRSAYSVGLAARVGSTQDSLVGPTITATGVSLGALPESAAVEVPLADAYSLRLNVSRRLYDRGTAMLGSPALAALIATSVVGLNHVDLDRLGVASGDDVVVSGLNAAVTLPVKLDDGVPRGTAEIAFNTLTSSGENALSALVDQRSVISQIRLETL
jgi:predicted molibdopterin-dependent oxidoreductase YjgC